MRNLLLFCTLFLAASASAFTHRIEQAETDSASTALASIWADYFKSKAASESPELFAAYKRGVTMALDSARVNDAFLQGLEEGIRIYRRLQQAEAVGGYEINMVRFRLAVDKALNGRDTGFTPVQADDYLNRLNTRLLEQDREISRGGALLDSIAKVDGIVSLPTGVLLQIITEGEGPSPDYNDLVMINYAGHLVNGTQFSGTEPDKPVIFEMENLIPGFRDGLTNMKKGGIYRLYIPSEQGYGSEGVFGSIPPDAVTIFDVELLDLRAIDGGDTPPAQ